MDYIQESRPITLTWETHSSGLGQGPTADPDINVVRDLRVEKQEAFWENADTMIKRKINSRQEKE